MYTTDDTGDDARIHPSSHHEQGSPGLRSDRQMNDKQKCRHSIINEHIQQFTDVYVAQPVALRTLVAWRHSII